MFPNKQKTISLVMHPICLWEIITLMFCKMFHLLKSSVDDTLRVPLGKIISHQQTYFSEYEVWKIRYIDLICEALKHLPAKNNASQFLLLSRSPKVSKQLAAVSNAERSQGELFHRTEKKRQPWMKRCCEP